MKRKVTIKDVAKAAGVSATTVSYVLNQNEHQTISEETKARIHEAVKQLKYIPNYAARIMKNNESRCVGIVISQSLDHRRYSSIVSGIVDALEEANYRAMICSRTRLEGQYSGYLEDCFRHHLEGLIYICNANSGPSPEEVGVVTANQIPFVVFDSQNQQMPYQTIDIDYYHGAVDVLHNVLTPNTKRLLYLRPCRKNVREEICERAVRDVMAQYPQIHLQVMIGVVQEDAWRKKMMADSPKPDVKTYRDFLMWAGQEFRELEAQDAIVISWAQWMPILYDMIQERKIHARLGAFAELEEDGWGQQPIVYGKYHNYQVGRLCVEMLMDAIHRGQDSGWEPAHKWLDMETRILNG